MKYQLHESLHNCGFKKLNKRKTKQYNFNIILKQDRLQRPEKLNGSTVNYIIKHEGQSDITLMSYTVP